MALVLSEIINQVNTLIPVYLSGNPYQLIASKTGVSGATIADTALTWATGCNLTTCFPTHIKVKYTSGTLGIIVLRVLIDTVIAVPNTALLTLVTGKYMIAPLVLSLLTLLPSDASKNIIASVTTASLGASTFDIEVYGIKTV